MKKLEISYYIYFKMNKLKRNKRAWIKIVESFLAILMIVSVLSVIVAKDLIGKNDNSDTIYEEEFYILQKIQANSSLRSEILDLTTIPLESTDPGFPFEFNDILNATILESFNCSLKICNANSICTLTFSPPNKEIYAKSILINSDLNTYNPRELAIFCWKD